MKRFCSVVLALVFLVSLAACSGTKEPEVTVEEKGSLSETAEALGYELLSYNTNGSTLTFESTAVVDDNIGQAVYKNGKSNVTLRMTLDKEKGENLAGYRNAGTAGAIEAPTEVFSKLSIQVVDSSTYFCQFTYTNCGCTCYLSLAETKTNLDLYSVLLIDYVNQLYNLEGIPSFVYAVDPSLALKDEAPTSSESAAASAQPETSAAQSQPQEEPDEENVKSQEELAQEEEKVAEEEAAQKAAEEEAAKKAAEEEAAKKAAEEEAAQKAAEEEAAKKAAEEEAAKKAEEEAAKQAEEQQAKGSITLTYYDITLVSIGDSYTFEPQGGSGGYTWKSANKKVATVTQEGTVKAVGKGTTKVSVKSGDGLTAEVIVRVPAK